MRAALRAISIGLAVLVLAVGAVSSLRWAKRHSTGAQLLASAMMLVLGIGGIPIVQPPQQGVEEAREDKQKKGSEESGDPPAHRA
jgi:hypothetical protein